MAGDVEAAMIANQRSLFDIPDDIAYFNCASLAPLMFSALEAGRKAQASRARPWTIGVDDWFDLVEHRRELLAGIVGARSENIALVPATSYGLATAARNLFAREGQRILLIAEDYPSAVYTWRRFCLRTGASILMVRRRAEEDWTTAILAALDERVAIVQVPNVRWTDGAVIDLPVIAERSRAVGAKLIVDASQSLGVLPIDLATVRPDFVVAVGYKWLLGPFGLGYLYVADQWLDGEPLEENWINRVGSDDFAALVDYQDRYQSGARRFDVGERTAFETTPLAVVALEQIQQWTARALAKTLRAKTEQIARGAADLGIQLSTRGAQLSHMVGLAVAPEEIRGVAQRLRNLNVFVGVRGSSIRISPHVYTTEEDMARLMLGLAAANGKT
jgi:selenocysteine lyase/cysteine desulfurase